MRRLEGEESSLQLILCRFIVIKHITSSVNKTIKLIRDQNTGELAVMKFYPGKSLSIVTEASFLEAMQGHIGIPNLLWAGLRHQQTTLITQYLGLTLQEHFDDCQRKFSLKTACMLGLKILPIIQNYHEKGILLRKLSLRTFQFGRGNKCTQLYLNDLGNSKRYRNRKTFEHIEFGEVQYFQPCLFSSRARFCGKELGRRDDLEAVLLMLVYMLKGTVPWEEYFYESEEPDFDLINQNSQFEDTRELCKGLPKAFEDLLKKCRSLSFVEEPNYFWFTQKIKALMYQKNIQNDGLFDWILEPSHQDRLVANRNMPTIKYIRDEQMLRQFYEPYAKFVSVDDLNEKYRQFQQRKNQPTLTSSKSLTQSTILPNHTQLSSPQLKSTLSSRNLEKSKGCILM